MRYLLPLVYLLMTSFAARATNWYVQAGQALQPIINQALPGDTITLQAGATFTGNFVLPNKSGTFVDHNSKFHDELASGGWDQRVNPSYAPFMAKLMSLNTRHYRRWLQQLARTTTESSVWSWQVRPGLPIFNVVQLGTGKETTIADLPSYIILDRLYIHGDPVAGGKRGVTLNSRYTNITNCYISDIKSTWQDSQAVGGWNGPGPFRIINNYLEASGENIMFGGARASIANIVPSNIVIKTQPSSSSRSPGKRMTPLRRYAVDSKEQFRTEKREVCHVRRQCNRKLLADGASRYCGTAYGPDGIWDYAVGSR